MSLKTEIEANFIAVVSNVGDSEEDRAALRMFAWALRISNSIFWLLILGIASFISPILGFVISPVVIFFLYTAFTGADAITRYSRS